GRADPARTPRRRTPLLRGDKAADRVISRPPAAAPRPDDRDLAEAHARRRDPANREGRSRPVDEGNMMNQSPVHAPCSTPDLRIVKRGEPSPEILERAFADARAAAERLREGLSDVIYGQDDVLTGVVVALLAGGHVLLEGAPGLGKTQ